MQAYWKIYYVSFFAETILCNQFFITVGHLVYQHRSLMINEFLIHAFKMHDFVVIHLHVSGNNC